MVQRSVLAFLAAVALACTRQAGERADSAPEFEFTFTKPRQPGASDPAPSPTPHGPVSGVCHPLYDPDRLPTYELEIDPDIWDELVGDFAADRDVFRPALFRFEGEEYPDAMVSYRGNNSRCGEKMQLAIAFNKVNPEGRFQGLRRLDIDHGSCRILNERMAFDLAREAGVEAPCANNVRVILNGEYYGLYANLEHVNREFLERRFGNADGNLYKAGTRKNNDEDPDTSDYRDYRSATDLESIDVHVDLDQAVRMWAVEALLPAADNYWYYGRNYYLYNHPERGFVYLPNDYDHAVPVGWNWDYPPFPATSHPTSIVLADDAWRERFLEELAAAHARCTPAWHAERLDRYWAQIREEAMADPFINATDDDIEHFKEKFLLRDQLITDFLASEGYGETSE